MKVTPIDEKGNIIRSASVMLNNPGIVRNAAGIAIDPAELQDNEVDSGNSSTSTLNSGIVFTGTGKDILAFNVVTVTLDSSHDSATDGISLQFSTDNTNWDDVYLFTYTAADGARRFQFPATSRYFRVVYTNGGTNQTHFRLQTVLHYGNTLTTIHRLVDDTSNDRSAQIVKAAIIAQKAGGGPGAGDFIAIQSTAAGNLKMSVQEVSDGLDVGAGNAGSETQRVSISTDDVNLAAINASTSARSTFDHGSNLDIDATAEQITSTSFAAKKGVLLKAGIDNSGIIYIGNSDVTAGGTASTDGMPLSAGESIEIEVDNPNKLYAIGSTIDQKIYWFAI